MLCNNYINGIEPQPGNQPIRVIGKRYKYAFENIRNELKAPPHNYKGLNSLQLNLIYRDSQAQGPSTNLKYISIHDTFLSFLWCYCYGLLVSAPMDGKNLTQKEYNETIELLKYALSLLHGFSEWDKEIMPNPELHGRDEKMLIGRSNACFWYAYNYVLYHEFAHVVLGHLKKLEKLRRLGRKIEDSERIEMEKEADLYALNRILEKLRGTKHEFSATIGIIAALGSITFTSSKFSGGKVHPDPDHRLRYTLESINAPANDYCWGFAIWSFIVWEQHFDALYQLWPISDPSDTLKSKFYESLKNSDKLKKDRL